MLIGRGIFKIISVNYLEEQPRIKSYDLIVGCEIVYCNGLFEKLKKSQKEKRM